MKSYLRYRLGCLLAFAVALPHAAVAQQGPAPTAQPPLSSQPVPGTLELSKMIWGTMVALDQANKSGNYSVLRDNASPAFQRSNTAARLSEIFASIRKSRVDLSNTLLLAPTYTTAPEIVQPNILRVRGVFQLRPTVVGFDLQFSWVAGRWRLFGISVGPQTIATQQPAATRGNGSASRRR